MKCLSRQAPDLDIAFGDAESAFGDAESAFGDAGR
jgi:hypothetical protein